jgi:hypothetical protein
LRVSHDEVVLVIINLGQAAAKDLHLALAAGPLTGSYQAAPILGSGPVAELTANSQGGFDAYAPVAELPAYSTLIVQLQPKP